MPDTATTADPLTKRQRYQALFSTLWSQRAPHDAVWREVALQYRPTRPQFVTTDRNRGDRRNQQIIDSTGVYAANVLQSGLHAGLTSPSRQWFRLTLPDPELSKASDVKRWLHVARQVLEQFFQISNLYDALPQIYDDMAVFGTAAMAIFDDDEELFHCETFPIGSFAIGIDRRGRATTFVHERQLSIRQLVEEFGGEHGMPRGRGQQPDLSRMSQSVQDRWRRGQVEDPVDVCWIVQPNEDYRETALDARAKPWASCWFEKGGPSTDTSFLRESGFEEFPVMAPRWFTGAGETYATSYPGLNALGDCKQLQLQQKTKAKAMAKMVDPPLTGPSHLRTQKVSMLPGDMTYADVREAQQGLRPIHEIRPDLQHFVLDIEDTRHRVRQQFYVDVILMLSATDQYRGAERPTAREVEERSAEKWLVFGPVLEKTGTELLDPIINRVFGMLVRQSEPFWRNGESGLLPPPPDVILGKKLRIEYTSALAQLQKMAGLVPQERLAQSTMLMAEAFPQVRHKFNVYRHLENEADMLGVDPDVLRSDEDADQLAQAEAQAAQLQAEAQALKDTAAGMASLGQTPTTGDTALSRMMQTAEGVAA